MLRATCLALTLILCWFTTAQAQTVRETTVELTATVQESPASITLSWAITPAPTYTIYGHDVFRRLKGETAWKLIASPAAAATTFTDNTVMPGAAYEYYVYRRKSGAGNFASGYVLTGIRVPVPVDRGRVLLLVDDTMSTPLATELATFLRNLQGDGWTVTRTEVARATATPPQVRALVQSFYAADPARAVAVILFGRIPVPYSGDFAIDGHFYDHYGAWPADAYYGDIDGVWTDTTVNDTRASEARVRNVPGDGKFDQTVLPSAVELQVGRIDLSNLPVFGASETELLRRYLDRNHAYRHRLGAFASVPLRGLVDDNFGYFGGEAFASTAWRGFTPCVGAGNVANGDWFTTLNTQPHLFAYGCGGGSYFQCSGVGSAADFNATPSLAVFNGLFGSYFGDWDNQNNFLRAPLAGTTSSLGLVSFWSGRPHWALHPLALGETIGYATRATQNNENSTDEGYESGYGAQFQHIGLLGDPTLRLYPVLPPANVIATSAANALTVAWTASSDTAIEGYLVARSVGASGPFLPLHSGLVTGSSFTDRHVAAGTSYTYQVRAVKLQTSPSGTFQNSSQGVYSSLTAAPTLSGPELNLSGASVPIAAGQSSPLTVNATDFGAVATNAGLARTFTITNAGTTALTIGSASVGGAHPGDFTITTPPPASIAAGQSATFTVRFQPLAVGARQAIVTVTSNDSDEASASFAIGGTGIAPAASAALLPASITRAIHSGDTAAATLTISNSGAGPLAWTLSSSLTRYSAIDSDSFAGPTYQWIDISTTGAEFTGWTGADDGISSPIALGLTFPFYGANFTSVRLTTNGCLYFSDELNSAPVNTTLPNRRAPRSLVALFWSDLNVDATSHVYTQKVGSDFIVQFENVSVAGNSALRVTCQAILKPSGEIRLQYKTVPAGVDYSIGIQNQAADSALTISAHQAYAHAGLAIRLRPPGAESWLTAALASGNVPAAQTLDVGATLNATGLASGSYFATLDLASNAADAPALSIPVRLTIGSTPVEDWRLANFGTTADTGNAADTANPDGDPHNNLLEYAFGSNPTLNDPPTSPQLTTSPAGYLQISFQRHAGRTDLRYFVQATSDLGGTWTTIARSLHGAPATALGARAVSESGASDLRTVTVEDTAPAATFPQRFLRVQVLRD